MSYKKTICFIFSVVRLAIVEPHAHAILFSETQRSQREDHGIVDPGRSHAGTSILGHNLNGWPQVFSHRYSLLWFYCIRSRIHEIPHFAAKSKSLR